MNAHISPESEFRAWRKRCLFRATSACLLAIPIGLAMNLPSVWLLGIAGVLIGSCKLLGMRDGRDPKE